MDTATTALVRKAQRGDREAFSRLVLENEAMLARVAMGYVKDPEDAADAVQDAVLEAWRSLCTLRQPRYFRTWLVRVLINKCFRILTLRGKTSHTPLEEGLPAESCADWDEVLDVRAALGSLREEERMLLGLYYGDGLSVGEIAQALGLSKDCVKQRLLRGRKRFKAAYLEKEELCHEQS